MPKNKKQKTKHHGSNHRGELSQAEIWDDSALIRSWNDAVAEYEVCSFTPAISLRHVPAFTRFNLSVASESEAQKGMGAMHRSPCPCPGYNSESTISMPKFRSQARSFPSHVIVALIFLPSWSST